MLKKKKQGQDNHDHEGDAVSGDNRGIPELTDENGPIWVNKFSEDSARAFVKQLHYQSSRDPTTPILIYIDSDGGDAYALLTMVAAIEQVPNEIITCALSKAMSAGAMLLVCGDMRFASEHSTIMIHEISAGTGGHIDDINTQHTTLTKLNEKLMKILVKKSKFKGGATALKKLMANSRDLYLEADEAKKLGFVDHIGIPMLHRNISVQYTLSSNPRGNNDDQQGTVKKSKN